MLSKPEHNYTIIEKECPAIVWTTQKFHPLHPCGGPFSILTDYHALCWLHVVKGPRSGFSNLILSSNTSQDSSTWTLMCFCAAHCQLAGPPRLPLPPSTHSLYVVLAGLLTVTATLTATARTSLWLMASCTNVITTLSVSGCSWLFHRAFTCSFSCTS